MSFFYTEIYIHYTRIINAKGAAENNCAFFFVSYCVVMLAELVEVNSAFAHANDFGESLHRSIV